MGKMIRKSYRIFVLFLLVSMSVFALSYERVAIEGIDSENYDQIKINLVSITDKDLNRVELLNVKEVRDGVRKNYDPIETKKIRFSNGDKVTIAGNEYKVSNNKIQINRKDQFVYKWNGSYYSNFLEEEGEVRTVSFKEKRYFKVGGSYSKLVLTEEYTEPTKAEPSPKIGEQWIYSQITMGSLVNSEKYTIDFYENIDRIKTIDEDGSLEELLTNNKSYDDDVFTHDELERYSYAGTPKPIVEFKLKETLETPKNGKFELTIEENNVFKRKINESYTIPVPITDFEEEDLESSKNTFTYKDKYELENLKAYKYQEVVFRLYTGSKHDEVRPIKRIEENDLNNIKNSYVDFVFENNGSAQEIEKDGIKGRFIEGKFEIMGLENGIDYNLDFYTLRYRNNNNKGNYAAITYEGSIGKFKGKNIASTDDTIWLEDIDTSGYKNIQLNMISITTDNLSLLNLENLKEKRNNDTKNVLNPPLTLQAIPVIGKIINIGSNSYTVNEDNQIILDPNNKRYVYRWKAEYKTIFDDKSGVEREVKFDVLGNDIAKLSLTGKYIEPAKIEEDKTPSHQWVIFEFDPAKEFKDQNYEIEDRVLSPERKGYRRLKTVDYESNLDDVLYGRNGYKAINEFDYSDGVWNYREPIPEKISSAGLIIEKTITESKGTLKDEDENTLLFYTDNKGDGIEKIVSESKGNKATFRWNEGPLNTNGEILNYDKVIFRITKKSAGADYSWDPYENSNSINLIEPTVEGNKELEEFLYGNVNDETYSSNYVDIVLDASTSKTMTFTNAIISYEQTNKELRIVGLPVDNYTIQFYSVKRGHDGRYKVITRENQREFKMDVSDIASLDFEKEKNIHKIDFITTGTSGGAIQVNVNFITKMEREIDLTVDNLKSGKFKIEEKNEGTGKIEGIGEAGNISLKESGMKKFLFPLDVVFVIDNSGSMQNEINNVKDGLSAFGQELYDRGFDVKYNLITFGPQQNRTYEDWGNYVVPTGDWKNKIAEYYDYSYMAIYKDKWFDGAALDKTSSRENDLEELLDAFEEINSISGYYGGQENSAWGIHYAIEKLRTNGRYLSYSGEIVEKGEKGAYMPSEKMIIFLTDEDMDEDNLPSGYENKNILEELSKELADEEFNGLPDVIDLNGIFHVRKRGNDAPGANNTKTTYDEVPGLGYKYSTGRRRPDGRAHYWEEWDDNEIPILGEDTSNVSNRNDPPEISHTDFKYYNTANNFFMYEMKNNGSGVEGALNRAINNLGIIQRWDLSYLTPFNEYDGTTRTVDFELVGLKGRDEKSIDGEITNLNEEEDKQYTVKEEKLALEFKDPSVDNLKLSIADGRGTITFRGKARYNEFDEDNHPIVVEDMINEYKLDVLDSSNKLLFSRNTDNITMSLSDDGWLETKVTKNGISKILEGREKSWVEVINNSGKDILSYIDKVRYTVEGENTYKIELMVSEVEKIKTLSTGDLKLKVGGYDIEVDEKEFEELMKDRSDTWYELKNTSKTSNLLDDIKNEDFEKIKDNEYRIKLRDLGLENLLNGVSGNEEGIELKISNTKLEELSDTESLEDTFGDQGWYEFKVDLTEEEMQALINSEAVKSSEKINLEARIVTDLFNKTGILKDVKVDLSTPKIINVDLKNKTILNFLKTMVDLDGTGVENPEKYSGYIDEVDGNFTLPEVGSTGKVGDEIELETIVEGKNIDEFDVYNGIDVEGWTGKTVEEISDAGNDIKRFKVTWTDRVEKGDKITLVNDVKNSYGISKNQSIDVLKVDNTSIGVEPEVKTAGNSVNKIGGTYYINSNSAININPKSDKSMAGIVLFEYDKEVADKNSDGNLGNPKYPKIGVSDSGKGLYAGGVMGNTISMEVDTTDKHTTDGQYIGSVYGMSKSGKLNEITGYDGTFNEILLGDISRPKNLTVIVDTIIPKITNILIEESAEISEKNYYYFNLSFDIEDFNASYEKLEDSIKGGYLLGIKNDNTEILEEPVYGGDKTVTYKIKVKKPETSNGLITEITITAEDKAGNRKEEKVKIRVPKDIKLKVYEDVQGWGDWKKTKIKDSDREYTFTKGGSISLINDPAIYAVVPKSTGPDDDTEITKLKIEKLNENENPVAKKTLDLPGGSENIEIKFNFSREGKNIVRVTPISKAGIEGKSKMLNFIVDTKINTSYLDNEIIGSLNGKNVEVDLSRIEELSGVEGYEYVFTVEGKKSEKITKRNLKGTSFTTPTKGSISGIITIETSGFIGGSKGTLLFSVYDKLGHKKDFRKTYFIPTKPSGIIAKVSGETKQRNSKITILAEGSGDKFEVESNVDGSSEEETGASVSSEEEKETTVSRS
ncbi:MULTISPECIES: vWA domain-containing protein [Psychrilyobacter]|uniref:VWA domain-containing protein n=1 Tax=Psychrilyobacter piezotolerans TaxID=2293438 RepID=A0ABX9KET8_9FUSO|nr:MULTISPECIES: vWA domain-containing protein [Psychrilyobacter]MCS5421544.1 VWA domain-containing protein [Psychrilyobacter sp. S5]NDI78667.1 VWA domain-containing protein [Psychrilyobacter piezotolerans]RDE60019.1 VWA domain-containing protein [Psychrilyobacter sp. S5]REI40246.1 VWA domain-containing protein [Psychrilyobacter piezotolerans]